MIIVYILIALLITLPITTIGYYHSKNISGALLCLLIAIPAWLLGRLIPIAGGPIIGLLLGMLLAQTGFIPETCKPGTKETGKRILQTAIVLFGFQMNLSHVLNIGSQVWMLLLAVVAVALILAYIIGKLLGLPGNMQTLIGVGTAICGGSAIAATAPIIKANNEEVATSISIIFLFNVVAVFVFPLVGHLTGMDDLHFGIWAGAAINDTSSVVAAGFSYSEAAGNTATVVKLTRTLLIIPITFVLAIRQSKLDKNKEKFNLRRIFPWFVAGFFVASVITTTGLVPPEATAFWGQMGRFLIVVAMVGIGLGSNMKELIKNGKPYMLLGFCLSLAVALVSLLFLWLA
ncbi:MAG: YeiH family protein [Defluviitaleaceae bacterium]|nr:YeiH family protein [Defluviitaleaceae bacterium]